MARSLSGRAERPPLGNKNQQDSGPCGKRAARSPLHAAAKRFRKTAHGQGNTIGRAAAWLTLAQRIGARPRLR